jgi:hypothetical protein
MRFSFSLRSRVGILSATPEACQRFSKVLPKFSLKRFKPRIRLRPRLRRTGFADLKLARLPPRSPLPFAALPSISLSPSARFTDDSEISRQLVAILVFSWKYNNPVTIWHTLSTGQVRRGGDMPKNVKARCTISALACSGELLAHETHE